MESTLLLGGFLALLHFGGASYHNLNDTALEWTPPDIIQRAFPYILSGYDFEGRPVFIIPLGAWPLGEVVQKGGQEYKDYKKYIEQMFYRIENGARLYGLDPNSTIIGDVACIIDAKGYKVKSYLNPKTIQHVLHDASSFQSIQHNLAYGIYVNVDAVGERIIHMSRPTLGSFAERIEVYGTQRHRWLPKILQKIGADQLPPAYGGKDDDFQPVAVFG